MNIVRSFKAGIGITLLSQSTEGELSRLYLRVIYELAEFAGVPIKEK